MAGKGGGGRCIAWGDGGTFTRHFNALPAPKVGNRKVQTTPLPLALEGDGALKCLSCARRLD